MLQIFLQISGVKAEDPGDFWYFPGLQLIYVICLTIKIGYISPLLGYIYIYIGFRPIFIHSFIYPHFKKHCMHRRTWYLNPQACPLRGNHARAYTHTTLSLSPFQTHTPSRMLPHITVQERLVLKALGIDDCSDTGSGAAGWARDTAAAAPGAGRVGAAVGSSGMPYVQGGAAAGGGAMPGARGGAASGGRGVPCRQGGAASGGTGIPVHRDWSHASQLEPGQQLQPGLQPCARSSGPGSGPAPNWAPRPASADDARNWRDQATPGARAFADMAQGRGLGDGVAGWAEGGREEGL